MQGSFCKTVVCMFQGLWSSIYTAQRGWWEFFLHAWLYEESRRIVHIKTPGFFRALTVKSYWKHSLLNDFRNVSVLTLLHDSIRELKGKVKIMTWYSKEKSQWSTLHFQATKGPIWQVQTAVIVGGFVIARRLPIRSSGWKHRHKSHHPGRGRPDRLHMALFNYSFCFF